MPIYEYKCVSCGCVFDVVTKYDRRDDQTICGHCGVLDYHDRRVSNCHFQFADGMPSYVANDGEVLDESEYDNSINYG